jgi:hypothetical protein
MFYQALVCEMAFNYCLYSNTHLYLKTFMLMLIF